jgi:uncharacterized membrane protein YcaP (DUF421 family)
VNELFGTAGHITWLQECARSGVIFGSGLLLVRIAGRRAFARWSALDIVVAIIVGSSLSRAQTGNAPVLQTLAGAAVLMALHWLFARASARSRIVSALVEGPAISLATAGTLNERALLKHNVSAAALLEALRQSGPDDAAKTRAVILEPSGKITVLR